MPLHTELLGYQKEGVRLARDWDGQIIFGDEQGLGKTFQALSFVKRSPGRRPAIIVCPASLKYNWLFEAEEHFGMRPRVLNGKTPKLEAIDDQDEIILNYDILEAWLPALIEIDPALVIFDELQFLKNRKSRRTQAAIALSKHCEARIGLTGTPIPNKIIELWSQVYCIRPDLWPTFTKFAYRYTYPRFIRRRRRMVYEGSRRQNELKEILFDNVLLRREKEEVLPQLPAKRRQTVVVEMDSRAEYDDANEEFILWLRKQSITRAEKARKNSAMLKVGYLMRLISSLKMKSCLAWVKDWFAVNEDKKLVIMTCHKATVDTLLDEFPKSSVSIDGRVTGVDRQAAVRAFQTNPKVKLMIGNVKAAGTGLTLTAASTLVFFDLPWVPGDLLQAEDRIHRIGQESRVDIIYLLARHTIEFKLLDVLRNRYQVIQEILSGDRDEDDLDMFGELFDE